LTTFLKWQNKYVHVLYEASSHEHIWESGVSSLQRHLPLEVADIGALQILDCHNEYEEITALQLRASEKTA
jgi:hypothetical protein